MRTVAFLLAAHALIPARIAIKLFTGPIAFCIRAAAAWRDDG
jgi:hypothetical protein